MGFYPVFVDLTGRPCLVVGGGPVAERKVDGLLAAGAAVTLVSHALTERLGRLAAGGAIRHIARDYRPGDLGGFVLVFLATDDGALNAAVAREAREAGIWVNAADDPARCDFILPAVLRRGDLTVAISTGGASPALTRALREELDAYLTPDYALLAEVVGEVRRDLRARLRAPDAATWNRALDGNLRALIAAGRRDEARRHLLERLGAAS